MLTLALLMVGAYALILLGLSIFQNKLLYHPDVSIPDPARSGVAEMHPQKAKSADGLALSSWYAEGNRALPVVVYLHGNAGNIGWRGDKVRPFLNAGYGVLLVGYRGFGGNPGVPSEAGLYADARAALSLLEDNRAVILYGESLGTAVATAMAAELAQGGNPVQALILEAPFPSVTAAAQYYYHYIPVKWLLNDTFDQASRIAGISAPVLIFHGRLDKTMPIRFGKALFEIAQMPKQSMWINGAGHNDLFDFGAAELSIEFIQQSITTNL